MRRLVYNSNKGYCVTGSIHLILILILFMKLFLLGRNIQWIMSNSLSSSQENLPRIRLYDCSSSHQHLTVTFKLSGLMSLIRCEFETLVNLHLPKSQYEPEITEETLRNFNSRDDQNRIEIIQTQIDSVNIYINSAARHLKMENVDLRLGEISIGKEGQDFHTVSVFELEAINCRVSAKIQLHLELPNSFAKFRFENTVFERISLLSEEHAGLASYVFDNCTFIRALRVDIQRFVDFKILRSSIIVPHDCQGRNCDVHLTGVDLSNIMSNEKLSEIVLTTGHTASLSLRVQASMVVRVHSLPYVRLISGCLKLSPTLKFTEIALKIQLILTTYII